jgi:nucleoside-diphosphate-sugar epimerase
MSGVLVSGATGFVGRALTASLLADGVEVAVVAGPSSGAAGLGDVRVLQPGSSLGEQVVALAPAVVVHLATKFVARHQPQDIDDLVETNIGLGTTLLDAAHRVGGTFVMTSSAWQHEHGRDYLPVSLYAATKQALADIAAFYRSEGLTVCDITLFDTYGPHDTRRKLVPALVEAARAGNSLDMSDGRQLIDLTYIDDVVRALRVAMLDPIGADGGVVRGPELVTVRELVERFESANGVTLDIRWDALPPRGREMRENWRFGRVVPDWAPQVGLDAGLRACLEGA